MFRTRRNQRTRDELSFHRERLIADYVATGMDRKTAERRAFLEFGNVAVIEEASKDVRGRWLEDFFKDLAYGFRRMRATPAFAAIAVAIIAIAVGGNTAVFSVVDAVLLRTLPVPRPHELRVLGWVAGSSTLTVEYNGGMQRLSATEFVATSFSYAVYEHVRDGSTAFADVFLFEPRTINTTVGGRDERMSALAVSGNFLSGLGVGMTIGRSIAPEDDRPSAPGVAVLTYGFWQRVFGADPGVIGQTLVAGGRPIVIVGVTARTFDGVQPGSPIDLVMPISAVVPAATLASARNWRFMVMGRIRSGLADERVRAETEALVHEAIPADAAVGSDRPSRLPRVLVIPAGRGLDALRASYAGPLYLLMTIMGAVLLVGCANIAGLLLTRGAARERELSVRLALGAGRARLIRQLLTESALLAGIGGAVGIGFAFALRGTLLPLLSKEAQAPRLTLGLSPSLLLFSIGLCLAVGFLCGVVPAFRATRLGAIHARVVSGSGTSRFAGGKALIALQIGLSVVLLVGAGLFVGTLINLQSQAIGFRPDSVLLFELDATSGRKGPELNDFYDRLLERLTGLPDVRAASLSRYGLLSGGRTTDRINVPDAPPGQNDVRVHVHFVSPRHFETMGIPIARGRDFSSADREGTLRVALANEALARLLPGRDTPIGRHVVYGPNPSSLVEIVGVTADARFATLRDPAPPTLYVPYRQSPQQAMTFAVRVGGDPLAIVAPVRQAVNEMDPKLLPRNVRTQNAQIHAAVRQERLFAYVASGFALLATCLACLGIYGTLAYAVSRRTAEIGLRMALGAIPRDVVFMVIRESLVPVIVGIAVGLSAVNVMTPLVESMLFGLTPHDATTLTVATLTVVVSALAAAWLPSRRASRIDPIAALRSE